MGGDERGGEGDGRGRGWDGRGMGRGWEGEGMGRWMHWLDIYSNPSLPPPFSLFFI